VFRDIREVAATRGSIYVEGWAFCVPTQPGLYEGNAFFYDVGGVAFGEDGAYASVIATIILATLTQSQVLFSNDSP
jgi:hypothetical protein